MYIQYNGNKLEIRKGQILFWNGQRIYAPIQLPDGTLVDKSGMYITIKTFFGIDVYYDSEDIFRQVKIARLKESDK